MDNVAAITTAPLTGSLLLAGIAVVSLEHVIAAPFATRQLADLGGRVIKIERPRVGNFARAYDARQMNRVANDTPYNAR